MTRFHPLFRAPALWRALAFLAFAASWPAAAAANAPAARLAFDISAGTADGTLKEFSRQSGLEVLFVTDAAAGVKTNAVKGTFTAREAIDRLLKGTPLTSAQDSVTGTMRVRRTEDPKASAPDASRSVRVPAAHDSAVGRTALSGRVKNTVTGGYVRNARVILEGSGLETFTSDTGEFLLPGVPAGAHRLRVTYTGMKPVSIAVTAPTDAAIEVELKEFGGGGEKDEVLKLGAFSVSTSREMSAAEMAINEKRIAPNVKEVIATDAFGNLAQDNLGEFLQYLPGVEVEGDAAAPLTVGLRGMPAEYTNIEIDGAGLSVPQTGGSTRVTALRGLTMSNVDRIEITKGPTPDSGADSIGGRINMVPRSAFERSKPEFRYRTFLLMNSNFLSLRKTPGGKEGGDGKSYKWFPDFELSYINPVTASFGFAVNASQNDTFNSAQLVQRTYSTTNTDATRPYLTTLAGQAGHSFSRRSALGTKFDYRLTRNDTLSVSYNFNRYWVDFGNNQMTYATGTLLAPAATGRNDTTGDFGADFTQGRPGQGSVTQLVTQNAYQTTQTHQGQLTYRHRGPQWDVESTFAKSKTILTYRLDSYGQIGQARLGVTGLALRLDQIDPNEFVPGGIVAKNAAGAAIDTTQLANLGTYTTPAYTLRDIKNNFTNAKADVTRKLQPEDFTLLLKSGALFKQASKDRSQPQITRNYAGPAFTALPPGTLTDPTFNLEGPHGMFKTQQWLSVKKGYDLYQANPSYFTTAPGNDYIAWATSLEESSEAISAGYVMADASFWQKRLRLTGGVRYEQTEVLARGTLTDLSLQYQQDANGKIIDGNPNLAGVQPIPLTTDGLQIAKLTRLPLANRVEQDYGDFYPSANATLILRENLLLRLGYAHTIGRPTLAQLIPTTNVSEVTSPAENATGSGLGTISTSNPNLQPWTGRNYDVALEYYTQAGGLFSVSGYRRDVRNFIDSVDVIATPELLAEVGLPDDYTGYLMTHPVNNSTGSVRQTGLELSARQRLRPNLSVFANYTRNRTEGTRASSFANAQTRRANAGIQFAFRALSVSSNYSWTGQRRGAASGIAPGAFVYTAPRRLVNLNVEYSLRRNFAVYATVGNLLNEPVTVETYGPDTPAYARVTSETKVGAQVQLGLKGSF